MLNEKVLAQLMKSAWKAGGYIVSCFNMECDRMILLSDPGKWTVACEVGNMPRKCLGLIVEHIGCIPENEAVRCMKDGEQNVILDMAKSLYADLLQTKQKAEGCMVRTAIRVGGLRLWQDTDSMSLMLMNDAASICNYADSDAEVKMVSDGILFGMTDAVLFVREELAEEYDHVLQALEGLRV